MLWTLLNQCLFSSYNSSECNVMLWFVLFGNLHSKSKCTVKNNIKMNWEWLFYYKYYGWPINKLCWLNVYLFSKKCIGLVLLMLSFVVAVVLLSILKISVTGVFWDSHPVYSSFRFVLSPHLAVGVGLGFW